MFSRIKIVSISRWLVILTFTYLSSVESILGQLTYYKDIEPIIQKNCVECHNPQGSAPFSLTDYKSVAKRAQFIQFVTETNYMPPWKANPHYRSFTNERLMDQDEKELIRQWIKNGKKEGKKKRQEPIIKGSSQTTPDLVLSMTEPFTIPGNNQQTYICYKIPYELAADTFVRAINFIPGNKQLVHHASYQVMAVSPDIELYTEPKYFIYGDSDFVNDQHDYAALKLIDKYGRFPKETYHGGWLPGSTIQHFPNKTGFYLPKRGIFLIRNLHYAPSAVEEQDQSSIELYFSNEPIERRVLFKGFAPINKKPEEEWIIPADSIKKFDINVKIGSDISLLSINPHMHLLGKYFKAYVITPEKDTIPLVEINEWDFNWQEFYHFRKLVKIPKGSFLKAEAIYDNTTNNLQNPFNPPKDVYFERGMDDKDEMMRLVFLYLPYKKGDENLTTQQFKK